MDFTSILRGKLSSTPKKPVEKKQKITVKRADARNLYSITTMTVHYFPYTGFNFSEIERRISTKNFYYYVALHDEATIGFVDFELKPERQSAQILGLAVLEEWRGKGVGEKLLQKAIGEVRKLSKKLPQNQKIKRIDLLVSETNPAALKLYSKHGFVMHGRLAEQLWGQNILVYTKHLK